MNLDIIEYKQTEKGRKKISLTTEFLKEFRQLQETQAKIGVHVVTFQEFMAGFGLGEFDLQADAPTNRGQSASGLAGSPTEVLNVGSADITHRPEAQTAAINGGGIASNATTLSNVAAPSKRLGGSPKAEVTRKPKESKFMVPKVEQ